MIQVDATEMLNDREMTDLQAPAVVEIENQVWNRIQGQEDMYTSRCKI